MAVTSEALSLLVLLSPPPLTLAVLVTLAGALEATVTVNVMSGYFAPLASSSLRVHVRDDSVQAQPVPFKAVADSPAGSESVTVTLPVVEPVPLLAAVSVYVAPVCPWKNDPLWVFVSVRSGVGET